MTNGFPIFYVGSKKDSRAFGLGPFLSYFSVNKISVRLLLADRWIPDRQIANLSAHIKLRCLNSWLVSHSAQIIGTLCHALGHEFKHWWQQTPFQTQAQHLCFLHDSICHVNCETENWKKIVFKEFLRIFSTHLCGLA